MLVDVAREARPTVQPGGGLERESVAREVHFERRRPLRALAVALRLHAGDGHDAAEIDLQPLGERCFLARIRCPALAVLPVQPGRVRRALRPVCARGSERRVRDRTALHAGGVPRFRISCRLLGRHLRL